MSALGTPEPTGHRDAVFGLWERDGHLLLLQNPRVVGGRSIPTWDLPGGAVRTGEGLTAALAREWREETGLDAAVGALALVVDGAKQRAAGRPPLYTWRAFTFHVASAGEPVPGDGIEAVAWVPRREATSRLTAPYHEALRRYLAAEGGAGPSYAASVWIDTDPSATEAEADAHADSRAEARQALRRLLGIAAAAAGGHTGLVAREVAAARAEGIPEERIAETLLQIVPYAGFPRTIAAFTAATLENAGLVSDTSPAFSSLGDEDLGREVFARVYGDTADRVAGGLERLHPALRAWTHRFAYGTVLARGGLTLLERELLAVSILTALGDLDDPLLGHMRAAIRLGATTRDVAAAVAAVPHALGEAKRDAARRLLDRL